MKKSMTTILGLLVCFMPAFAQTDTLTIERCREMALENNKSLKSADLLYMQAQHTRKSTRAMFFPDISLNGFGAYSNGSGALGLDLTPMLGMAGAVIDGLHGAGTSAYLSQKYGDLLPKEMNIDFETGWMYGGHIMLKQPLFMGGKIVAGYRMSRLAVLIGEKNRVKTQAEVIEKSDHAYATLVKANEMRLVAEKYRELLLELDRNVESAVRHGMRLENDRMKVRVKLNEAELQIRRAENGIRLATMNLCHVIGIPLTEHPVVSNRYPVVEDAWSLLSDDVTRRPEYALLDYQVQMAEQKEKVVRSEMLPQLALLATYGYANGIKVMDQPLLDSWNFAGGVTLSVPLFHFGERYHRLKAAKLQKEQAMVERADKVEMMRLELAQSANNMDEARLECELAGKSLEQAEINMRLSHKQYLAGTETLSEYLEAQLLWQQASQTRIDANFRHYLSSVAYLKAAGLLVAGVGE